MGQNIVPLSVTLILVFLIALPVGIVILRSLTSSTFPFSLQNFGLGNFLAVFSASWFPDTLANTIALGLGSSLVALAWSTPLAWLSTRTNMPGRAVLESMSLFNLFVSEFFLAFGWSLLASPRTGLVNKYFFQPLFHVSVNVYSLEGMIWVMGTAVSPIAYIVISSAMRSVDPYLEESARIAGGSTMAMLRHVTLPLVLPGVISGFILTFASSIEAFAIPVILGGPSGVFVFTSKIFEEINIYPQDWNSATTLGVLSTLIIAVLVLVQRRVVLRREGSYTSSVGRGIGSTISNIGRWRWVGLVIFVSYVVLTVALPYATIFYASLLPFWSGSLTLNLTLTNFNQFVYGPYSSGFLQAIANSFEAASLAALAAVIIGAIVAWVTYRSKTKARSVLDVIISIPLAVPGIVIGIAFVITYTHFAVGIYGTIWVLVLAYITRFTPNSTRIIIGNVAQLQKELEEAARVMGAGWLRTFQEVTLPLLKQSLIGAGLVAFVLSFKELPASIFLVTTNNQVIAPYIFNSLADRSVNFTSALIVTQIVIITIVILVVRYAANRFAGGLRY